MKDELITFDTAKLSKEKGFEELTYFHFNSKGVSTMNSPKAGVDEFGDDIVVMGQGVFLFSDKNRGESLKTKRCSQPTQSLLQRWLREVHDIFVSINTISEERWYSEEDEVEYIPVHKYRVIKNRDNFKYDVIDWSEPFETYEQALEIGLQEALKLINK